MYGFVYETTNNLNGMKYIGKCVYARKCKNVDTYLGSGVYLKRAINKYGKENFSRRILIEAKTKQELEALEEEYILKNNAVLDPMYYNLKFTSIGGDTYTYHPNKIEISKTKSKAFMGTKNPAYNRKTKDSVIKAVKKANSKSIIAKGKLYSSAAEASRSLGIPVSTLLNYADSKKDEYSDFIRLHKKKDVSNRKHSYKPIKVCIDNVIYDSVAEAARQFNCSTSKIKMRCKSPEFKSWKYQ